MKYAQVSDEGLTTYVNFTSPANTLSVDHIVDSLLESESFERLTKTNRAMWPDEKTVGVKSEQPNYKLEIRSGKINISVDDIDYFDTAYDHLESAVTNTNIHIPNPSEFTTDTFTLSYDDEQYQLTYDETKCVKSDDTFSQCKIKIDDRCATYSELQGMITFRFGSELSRVQTVKTLENALSRDFILVVRDEETRESV